MSVPKIQVRIERAYDAEGAKLKAVASVTIADAFCIHNVKVLDSSHGIFVQMPQSTYEKDGQKHYIDLFHPITAEAREAINEAVLDAYGRKLNEQDKKKTDGRAER